MSGDQHNQPETTMTLAQLQHSLRATLPMAHLERTRLPGVAEIELALINADFPTGPLPQEVMQAVIAEPAYWAFCWGSGLAMARFLLDEPAWVAGKTVVDLGCGSGVAAISAALAGATRVIGCDTDQFARDAARLNAALNGVEIEISDTLPPHCDLLLMADVLYDKQNLGLLSLAQAHACEVLVADSRVTTLPDSSYTEITTINALTFPNLGEFDEFATAHLFHWRG